MDRRVVLAIACVFFSGWICGCAQKKIRSDDRLTRLFEQNRERRQLQEERIFQHAERSARQYEKSVVAREYPLPKFLTEESLYTEIIRNYQMRQLDAVNHYVSVFLKKYPQSVFADSALYLRGELYLIMGMTSSALRDFERIISDYPEGSKYVAAMYGKAVCYRKLELYDYAEQVLKDLRKMFPGSPEVVKAALEEKVLQAARDSGNLQQ